MPLSIGPVKVYALIYGASVLAYLILIRRGCRRLALPGRLAIGFCACYVLGMAVGARVLYDVVNHRFDAANYLRPGYYFSDGLWGGPLAYFVIAIAFAVTWSRRKASASIPADQRTSFIAELGSVCDPMVLALPIPLAIIKLACLVNGCCFGSPCDWPWGIVYPYRAVPPAGIARHPTQLYEVAAFVFIHFVLITLERRRWNGLLILWFVLLYGLARPVTEFFRMPSQRPIIGVLTATQGLCLLGALFALASLWLMRPPRRAFEPPLVRPSFA